MIGRNGMCNILQHYRLTGTRRRNNKTALTFALRSDKVNNAGCIIFIAANDVKIELFGRIKRGQIVKIDVQFSLFGVVEIDTIDFC